MITMREAIEDDFDRLMELKLLAKEEEFRLSATLRPPSETREHYARYLRQDLADENRAVFIAEEGGQIAGVILAKTICVLPIHRLPTRGYMSNLYVRESFRKRGIGEKLVRCGLTWLTERGVPLVSVEIHTANPASLALHRKLGFEDHTVKMTRRLSG